MTSIEDTLNKIYYDPSKGLVSEDKFYAKVKHLGITRKDVHEYIKKQKVNQLHKPVIIKHKNYYPIRGLPGTYQMDIMFYSQYKQQNRGYTCMLCIIEVTSRRGYIYKMKSKADTYDCFKQFLSDIKYDIRTIGSDSGTEFLNNKMNKLLKEHHILHIIAQPGDHAKQGKIERFNKTIRNIIERYFTAFKTVRWENVINSIVDNYNNTVHSAIGIAPADVTEEDEDRIRLKTAQRILDIKNRTNQINLGDDVRIVRKSSLFEKGAIAKYSDEIYTVYAKDGTNGYRLKNSDGNVIPKAYQTYQLQPIKESKEMPVEAKDDRAKIDSNNRVRRRVRKAGVDETNIINKIRSRTPKRHLIADEYMYE